MFKLLWNKLQTTIWFIPALLSLAGVVFAMLMVNFDLRANTGEWAWLDGIKIGTAGVRQVLAVTTGAMMTITGVVFSISVVTLTLAANQFGAKILRNYLSDWHNKIVLGLFVGSFLYGLVVLASINSDSDVQLPALAFLISLVLTVLAIAGLIFFIHNISTSIQADRVIAVIGKSLINSITNALSSSSEQADSALLREGWAIAVHGTSSTSVCADASGYVEYIDYDALVKIARRCQCAIELKVRPGAFVIEGGALATLHASGTVSPPSAIDVNRSISLGLQRTDVQDLEYAMMQLLQIAQRALSPGINDSLTAIACIDWLSAALARMVELVPSEYLTDADSRVRLRIQTLDFSVTSGAIFDPLRQDARGNKMVTARLLGAIVAIMTACQTKAHLDVLREHAERIYKTATIHILEAEDVREIKTRYAACVAMFDRQLLALSISSHPGSRVAANNKPK